MKKQGIREYVIVCNEHNGIFDGSLLFWGRHTSDSDKRSFGGYTSQFDKCEKYTREEIEQWRMGVEESYPFFDEIDPKKFRKYNEVVCTQENLESIGYEPLLLMVRW